MSEPQAEQPNDATQPLEGLNELAHLEEELAEARAQASQQRDLVLRAAAELDNIRKRAARDVEQAHRFALEKFVQELLPAVDSLELAVASADRADAPSLAAGQEATLKLLLRALEKFSVQPIEPQGERFDPQRHEAMVAQESATAEPDSVLQVVQRGYELNGRLLRPARVIVSRAPESA
ncbi:MAG TPA: nucleotide exchange factor GrpE [Steroidobacteraceae bacterium]|nr:nucleotide exchange factor GrpE [Steroidobacteraceae bacterium]